jgi:anti-anti-sigma factor
MFSVNLSTREDGGHIIVALAAVAARNLEIIVDLSSLDFIDSSGVAALARGRKHARHAGGDLVLAAPQQQVLRVLTLTRLAEIFHVHASVDEAAASARHSELPAAPAAGSPVTLGVT